MAVDFSNYLSKPVTDIEAPKPIPPGHYFAEIVSWKATEVDYKQGRGKQPIVELTFRTTSPDSDVETDLLPPNGGVGALLTRNYGLDEESGPYQLRRLCEETCDLPTEGLSLGDALAMLPKQEVKVYVEHRPGREEGQFFPQVKQVLSARS